jgi:signal transduction histidine kinase
LGKRNPIISVSSEKNQLEIQIKDFGIGIPLTEQGKMYSSFFRAKNVGIIEGTGLGLVIVKNLVQLNNGHIYFVSSENQGTTFSSTSRLTKSTRDLFPLFLSQKKNFQPFAKNCNNSAKSLEIGIAYHS